MRKRLFAIPLCFAILTGLIQSCSLDIPYENQFSDPDAISTPQAARELLATAYSQLPHPEFNLSVMSDEFTPTGWIKRNADLENLYKWEPSPLRDLGTTLWQDYYAVVATLNALLERLPAIPATSDEARRQIEQIEAEAKVLKAYCYFDLLRLFGSDYRDGKELPGILMKDRVELQFLPRTSVEGCVEGIRRLLLEASAVMQAADTPYWLGREACLYLQAEVELYAGNYKEAATLADRLLTEKGTESLTTTAYANLWSDNSSTERIFAYYSPTMASSFYQDIVYDSSSGDYLALNEYVCRRRTPRETCAGNTPSTRSNMPDTPTAIWANTTVCASSRRKSPISTSYARQEPASCWPKPLVWTVKAMNNWPSAPSTIT